MTFVEADLIDGYRLYDRSVDVVSAFEYLFVGSKDLPATVRHFERYPEIQDAGDGHPATPDFSVLFEDGTGLVGEIANFALPEESVDDLCHQIGRYDSLTELPGSDGTEKVSHVDVLLAVPLRLGTAAVQRIIRDRLQDEDHPYGPSAAPCIVQFGEEDGVYVFSRLGEPENGVLREEGRDPAIGRWLMRHSINIRIEHFRDVKAARAFVNDPTDRLYLATHLWSKTFPTIAGDAGLTSPAVLSVTAAQLAQTLRDQFGVGRQTDVERAMGLLVRAGLAEPTGTGKWDVAWNQLSLRGGHTDLHQTLASRAESPPRTSSIDRVRLRQAAKQPAEPPPQLPFPE